MIPARQEENEKEYKETVKLFRMPLNEAVKIHFV